MAYLHIVATPIGNLEDITLRALHVLKEADYIACEDTRVTKKLLLHYDIQKPLISFHAHSNDPKLDRIIALLEEGNNVAYVSDAGTPAISDPGAWLVSVVRERLGDECRIVAIPGASALTAALSVSGIAATEFVFLGFLPHKKGRQTLLSEISTSKRTVVCFESSHRIEKFLTELKGVLSSTRRVVIVREITKYFEETLVGTSDDILHLLMQEPEKKKGEFVVIIEGI